MKKVTLFVLCLAILFCGAVTAQEAKKEIAKPSVFSKFPVKFYGYLKADMVYDDSWVYPGQYALYAMSEATNNDDSDFQITGRQSRFGLKIDGPSYNGVKTGGCFELDFTGGGAENKWTPRIRHAYLTAKWDNGFELLAGQHWDLVSYLNCGPTINMTPLWYGGNIGIRRPQFRLTKCFKNGDMDMKVQVALARTIGTADGDPPYTPGDTGEDADHPTLQGRFELNLPLINQKKAMFALSGHYGAEEYDTDNAGTNEDVDTWSLCFDFQVPVNDQFKFNGSFWTGTNMSSFMGGIGQGVVVVGGVPEEIDAMGGFLALTYTHKDWVFNAGYGFDDPDDDDLAATAMDKNTLIFGNAWYNFTKELKTGFEIMSIDTEFKAGANDGDALRFQWSWMFSF